jgi:nucleoside-diphosphate-sugar epimerase
MKVLLIGGTGTISAHTHASLVADGHDVTLLKRTGRGSNVIIADRQDRAALADAITAVRPDVLIDFVCFAAEDATALADAAAGKIGHLIFVSSVDAFGFPQPVPTLERAVRHPGVGAYALAKQASEDLLLARTDLKVTVARPTYSMSEKFVISLFNHQSVALMQRLRRGEAVVLTDGGKIYIHPSDSRDTGRMIAAMAGAPQAVGKTYTAGSKGVAMPQRAYVDLIASAVGGRLNAVSIPLSSIDAMQLKEAENTVFSNVTRFNLDFAFEQFSADFPNFAWHPDLSAQIGAYAARVDREGQLDGPPIDDLEGIILERWQAR